MPGTELASKPFQELGRKYPRGNNYPVRKRHFLPGTPLNDYVFIPLNIDCKVMNNEQVKLRERVKELKCLYGLSKTALEAGSDVNKIFNETLKIVPAAMQYPELAEASIAVGKTKHSTKGFRRCENQISAQITIGGKMEGTLRVGYRNAPKKKGAKPVFMIEEKHLIKTVARELSLFIRRANVEVNNKNLEMQLQHSKRLAFVGELSAGIAHELNEPLGKILGFAQLVKKNNNLDEQQVSDIDRIIKASLYAREIIKKLMIFSRQMPRQIRSVNVNEIISSVLYFIDVRFQSRGIKIEKKLDTHLPLIQADSVQISQVLVNLITNSIHSLSAGGSIMVETKHQNDQVILSVKDSGCGMSREVIDKIFQPFYTTKPVGQGTGLGLSVVQAIVEDHHGKISVKSTIGKGSKFQIQLPVKQPR